MRRKVPRAGWETLDPHIQQGEPITAQPPSRARTNHARGNTPRQRPHQHNPALSLGHRSSAQEGAGGLLGTSLHLQGTSPGF